VAVWLVLGQLVSFTIRWIYIKIFGDKDDIQEKPDNNMVKPQVLNTQNNQNSIEIQEMIPNESLDNSIRQSTERAKPQVPKYDFYDITNLQEEPID